MGNHLKANEQQIKEDLAVQKDYRQYISTKVGRQVEMRLEVVLRHNFPERWKCFCFGSFLNMKSRYRGIELPITELQNMMGQITKNVQVSHVRPVGVMTLEPNMIRGLTDATLVSYGAQIAKHLSKLREFTISALSVEGQRINFDAKKSFIQKIARNMSRLQKLNLNLSGQPMDDEVLEMISSELTRGLVNLRSIEITVSDYHQVTNQGFGSLFSGLNRYSNHLKHLELCCSSYLDDEKIAVIGENLHRNLANLKSFVLKFQETNSRGQKLTDKGLEILGSKIGKHLINLEHLTLSFFYNKSISDKGTEVLLSKICSSVKNLKSLSLGFAECSEITDLTFKQIFTLVSETQNNLVSLSINLKGHHTIDQSTFKFLRSTKKIQLNSLRHLKLNFMGSYSINDDALFMLRDWIRERLPRLKSFFLNILECHRPTRECMLAVKKDLGFIPDLDISVRLAIIFRQNQKYILPYS